MGESFCYAVYEKNYDQALGSHLPKYSNRYFNNIIQESDLIQ